MSNDLIPVARNLLFLTNIFHLVRIDKLIVPELVEVNSTDVILDCQYTVPDENFTLRWTLNDVPVFDWSPPLEPKVHGILRGRLDLAYTISKNPKEKHRALRVLSLTPELSGNYTCVIDSHGAIAHRTKHMLIYSLEREFDLITEWENNSEIEVSCIVRGVNPRPDLTIEFNNAMVSGQRQRVWRDDRWLYHATGHARVVAPNVKHNAVVACRLELLDADYAAIKKKIVFPYGVNRTSQGCIWRLGDTSYYLFLTIFLCRMFY